MEGVAVMQFQQDSPSIVPRHSTART